MGHSDLLNFLNLCWPSENLRSKWWHSHMETHIQPQPLWCRLQLIRHTTPLSKTVYQYQVSCIFSYRFPCHSKTYQWPEPTWGRFPTLLTKQIQIVAMLMILSYWRRKKRWWQEASTFFQSELESEAGRPRKLATISNRLRYSILLTNRFQRFSSYPYS